VAILAGERKTIYRKTRDNITIRVTPFKERAVLFTVALVPISTTERDNIYSKSCIL
jgi:hypothetical protein